jgi:hypothetical protein
MRQPRSLAKCKGKERVTIARIVAAFRDAEITNLREDNVWLKARLFELDENPPVWMANQYRAKSAHSGGSTT